MENGVAAAGRVAKGTAREVAAVVNLAAVACAGDRRVSFREADLVA
jgi:hypothetical protein